MEKQKFNHIVSLGYSCLPRVIATRQGFKPTLEQGELALPFDLAEHGYEGLCGIIESGFEDYCNPDFLEMSEDSLGQPCIEHTKYGTRFFHEAQPGKRESFTAKNYTKLLILYRRRIDNFYRYIADDNILFIAEHRQYPHRLNQIIRHTFPNLTYKIIALNTFFPRELSAASFYPVERYDEEVDYYCLPFPTDDYVWWMPTSAETEIGVKFENRIGNILSKYVDRINPQGTSHQE